MYFTSDHQTLCILFTVRWHVIGYINHDIVIGLCFKLLMSLSYYIHLGYGQKFLGFCLTWESKSGPPKCKPSTLPLDHRALTPLYIVVYKVKKTLEQVFILIKIYWVNTGHGSTCNRLPQTRKAVRKFGGNWSMSNYDSERRRKNFVAYKKIVKCIQRIFNKFWSRSSLGIMIDIIFLRKLNRKKFCRIKYLRIVIYFIINALNTNRLKITENYKCF